jgi:hypothetical protein
MENKTQWKYYVYKFYKNNVCVKLYGVDIKKLLSKVDPFCEVLNGIRE